MKTILPALLLLFSTLAVSQPADTLLHENFESGGGSFTLNTADMGGVSALAGYNQWLINNIYAGGSGSLICAGFPTTFTVPNTPPQPAAITGNINSNYMHISSDASQAAGILNCSYLAANGLCGDDEFNFAAMSQDVVTTGYDSVTVSFLWINAGGANIFGEVYYSTDAGLSWTVITVPISQYQNQGSWVMQNISIPAFANQGSLRVGFRFVNQVSFTANDPGFGIDEFMITAQNSAAPPVAAFSVSDSTLCEGDCVVFTDMTSGDPTSWLWIFAGSTTNFSNQQNPSFICYLNAGTYDVTLIVENSAGTDTLTTNVIIVNPSPQPVITVQGDTLIAPPGYASYQWLQNTIVMPGETDDILIVTAGGSYTVNVTDTNGCFAAAPVVLMTTGLPSIVNDEIFIYPNPASNYLVFSNVESITNIRIIDSMGRVVKELLKEKISIRIDVSDLAGGIYSVVIIDKNQIIKTGKVVITK